MHRLLYYRLSKIYERVLTLVKTTSGPIDYEIGISTAAQERIEMRAIVLPVKICSEFFKGLVSHNNRLERGFFFETEFAFDRDTNHIMLDGQRHNIKEVTNLSPGYWLVLCTAENGDKHE